MNLLIINAHLCNRGDEAAVRAMVDELLLIYPNSNITISEHGKNPYPNMPKQVCQISRFPLSLQENNLSVCKRILIILEFFLILASRGTFAFTNFSKSFLRLLSDADLVIHAPGGPSIGDIYFKGERIYLWVLDLIRRMNKPYMFYAPSMGPFYSGKRSRLRRKVLLGAEKIVLRDPISLRYLQEFLPEISAELALDSAFQHDIDRKENANKIKNYNKLNDFLVRHEKSVGITITDLKWHPQYEKSSIKNVITKVFNEFIAEIIKDGFGVIFIPQLYGSQNDTDIMNQFMKNEHTFMVEGNSDKYDAYFQQYLISQLYAVVGMRYHSNIFSAKMGTPFVSISYEQKMKGFMERIGLTDFCLDVAELNIDLLNEKFSLLIDKYNIYKRKLIDLHDEMKTESYKSTKAVIEILEKKQG